MGYVIKALIAEIHQGLIYVPVNLVGLEMVLFAVISTSVQRILVMQMQIVRILQDPTCVHVEQVGLEMV